MSKYISVTDTAKLVRKALKANFTNTTFSVKSKSYSGGASITVSWVDGPTSRQVDAIIRPFSGASFDGMTDMKSYHDSVLDSVEVVHFGADHVFTNRETSISFRMKVAKAVCAYFKLPVPVMNRYNWFDRNAETSVRPTGGNDDLLDLFIQVLSATNADDGSLHASYIPEWIERVWEHATNQSLSESVRPALREGASYTPEGGVIISAALIEEIAETAIVPDLEIEAYPEAEDLTPCVKVNPLTLEVIEQPMQIVTIEEDIRGIRPDALREKLSSTNLDNLSPLEALTLLYELKRLA